MHFFLTTNRIGFSKWQKGDIKLAELLWGDPDVTKLICASGKFSVEEISSRLTTEIDNETKYHVQYWPIFELSSTNFIGCCVLRPYRGNEYEMGFHLRPQFWGKGYATEAAAAIADYAFSVLKADALFAGHNPNNVASSKVLLKLGFRYIGNKFYEPTGLYHPSYELKPKL